jgi:zinc protease
MMKTRLGLGFGIVALAISGPVASQQIQAPTTMKKLANGLQVVVSEDHSAPTFGVCVSYGIGFRVEPEGRTGFAHLFEHMMFEGTPTVPKGVMNRVIEGGGGDLNGDTRYDYTEYIETAPLSALDPILWLEANRMTTLDFSPKNLENQRNVVEEEVRVNVMNQPYGLFYAIDLPGKAFDTYPNAHNFYGEFKDLDAAKIADVQTFYEQYYAPNNAAIAVVGDVQPAEIFTLVEKYFGGIPSRPTPARPNFEEPPQKAERRSTETDKLAKLPAIAIGYHVPPRHSREALAGAVLGDLMHNGTASLLYQTLVKRDQVASDVSGGVNWPLGAPFEYNGPTLLTSFILYPPGVSEEKLLAAYDAAVKELSEKGPSKEDVQRVVTKMRSDWYDQLESPIRRASALSHAVLFDGDFKSVYAIPDELEKVTPEEIRSFAAKYLVPANRTIINRVVAPGGAGAPKGGR